MYPAFRSVDSRSTLFLVWYHGVLVAGIWKMPLFRRFCCTNSIIQKPLRFEGTLRDVCVAIMYLTAKATWKYTYRYLLTPNDSYQLSNRSLLCQLMPFRNIRGLCQMPTSPITTHPHHPSGFHSAMQVESNDDAHLSSSRPGDKAK